MAVFDQVYVSSLVEKAQQNDGEAFGELYSQTYHVQYAFARRYLRDDDYAQDAVQEAYLLALKNIHKLKEPKYFNTWLLQINSRVCYDLAAREKKLMTVDNGESELEAAVDEGLYGNPEKMFLKNVDNQALEAAIGGLPDRERNAIEMKYLEERSLNDIAELLNCSISSVTRYLSRGYKKLRIMLEETYLEIKA